MSVDLRFALRPKWIAGHLLAVVGIVVFVQLGLWQLRRLDERQTFNETLVARSEAGFTPLAQLLEDFGSDPRDLALRRVEVSGVYDVPGEVIIQGRSNQGRSGHHVATPLLLEDGSGVIVDRGWVPIDVDEAPAQGAAPPPGTVVVRGLIRESQQPRPFEGDPGTGSVTKLARVDLPRLQSQSSVRLADFYIELEEQDPAQSTGLPVALTPPVPDEGPHRSYAVQWFLFAGVVVVGYPILLYRTGRRAAAAGPAADSGHAPSRGEADNDNA